MLNCRKIGGADLVTLEAGMTDGVAGEDGLATVGEESQAGQVLGVAGEPADGEE